MVKADIDHFYSFINNSITFKRKLPLRSLRDEVIFKNVRFLGKDLLKKLVSRFSSNDDLIDFLDYKMDDIRLARLSVRDKYRYVILIKKRHVGLIEQIFSHSRTDLGMGIVLLIIMVTEDVVTDAEHLDLLLSHQVELKTNLLLCDDLQIYSLPHYSSSSLHGDELERNISLSVDFANRIAKINPIFILSAFVCDSRELTFGQFINNPRVSFNSPSNFKYVESFIKWYESVNDYISIKDLSLCTVKQLESISNLNYFIKVLLDDVQDVKLRNKNNLKFITSTEMVKFLLASENLDRILTILEEDMVKHYRGIQHDNNTVLRYYLYCMIGCNPLGDVEEFLQLYENTSNKDFFKTENNMIKLMEYFDSERTMSLDMWVLLNDVIEEPEDD